MLSLPKGDAIAILGSEAKYFEYRQNPKLSVLDIVDRNKPKGYETALVGDVVYNDGMKSMYFGRSLQPAKPIANLDDSEIKARDIVVSAGIASGNEHGVAVSVATGEIVQRFTSDKPDGIAIPQFSEKVVIHHNHPLGDGFSRYDLGVLLTNPYITSIYAHGHENQYSFATFDGHHSDMNNISKKMMFLPSIGSQIATKIYSDYGVAAPMGVLFYLNGLVAKHFGLIDRYEHNPPADIANYLDDVSEHITNLLKEAVL